MVDQTLPETLVGEAPAGIEILRYRGAAVFDEDLLRAAAREQCRAVVFFDRRSLSQPGLRELAEELGVGIVAVQADDPVEAKERLLANFGHLRRALAKSSAVLVLASEARPAAEHSSVRL